MGRSNALWNVKNPNQGAARRVLTVCSAGLLRSPTAAAILTKRGYNARSCGTTDFALIKLDEVLFHWADVILFMNSDHRQQAEYDFDIDSTDWRVLGIEDDYEYMQPELVELIESALDAFGLTEEMADRSKMLKW